MQSMQPFLKWLFKIIKFSMVNGILTGQKKVYIQLKILMIQFSVHISAY